MLRVNYLKIKHQPLLLGVSLLIILYGLYFIFKIKPSPANHILWFKTGIVYLNCLAPFLVSLIIAIQRKFEDQKPNFYSILSMPNRTKWLLSFSLETYSVWLINVLIFNLLFLGLTSLPLTMYINLWLSLAILTLAWFPLLEYLGVIHGYLASIAVGIMAIPFTVYYGTSALGADIWRMVPWAYSIKVYLASESQLIWEVITILLLTLVEQLLVNWRFNHWLGN